MKTAGVIFSLAAMTQIFQGCKQDACKGVWKLNFAGISAECGGGNCTFTRNLGDPYGNPRNLIKCSDDKSTCDFNTPESQNCFDCVASELRSESKKNGDLNIFDAYGTCGGDDPENDLYKFDFNEHGWVPTDPGHGQQPY